MTTGRFCSATLSIALALYITACATTPPSERVIATEVSRITAADVSPGCVAPGSANKNISLLLIGNSLMNDVQSRLETLLTCGGYTTDIATSNPGGYRLEQHVTNEQTMELIARGYDLTLIQAHSNGIKTHRPPFNVLKSLQSSIEAAGSTMGFYQTWAFQNRNPVIAENILSRYEYVADEFDAPIVHIGRAWDYFYISHKESPPFSLFTDYAHATDQGKSLISFVLYAYLTGNSPIRMDNLSLSEDQAVELQTVAWATYNANAPAATSAGYFPL